MGAVSARLHGAGCDRRPVRHDQELLRPGESAVDQDSAGRLHLPFGAAGADDHDHRPVEQSDRRDRGGGRLFRGQQRGRLLVARRAEGGGRRYGQLPGASGQRQSAAGRHQRRAIEHALAGRVRRPARPLDHGPATADQRRPAMGRIGGDRGRRTIRPSSRPGPTTASRPGGPRTVNANNNWGIYAFHPHGANILLCDGSVHFVAETLDRDVFAGLVTKAGGEPINANKF